MIPTTLTRPSCSIWPIGAGTTILVIILHGLAIWALISMESPERPEIKVIEPAAIQLELVTLATLPAENPRTTKPLIAAQSERQPKPQSKKQSAEPIKAKPVETVKPALDIKPLEPVEPLKLEPKKNNQSQ